MGKMHNFVISVLVLLTATILVNESVKSTENETERGSPGEQKHIKENTRKDALPCAEHADCNNPKKVCNCDSSCEIFNDCCNLDFRNVSWSDKQRSTVSRYKSCVSIKNVALWILDNCPENSSVANTYDNKTQLFQELPVTDQFDITYRNAKIAECHGVSDFLPWRMSVSNIYVQGCPPGGTGTIMAETITDIMLNKSFTADSLAELLFENSCSVGFYPPEGRSIHYCRGNVTSAQNCSPLYRPIYNVADSDHKLYHNLDCCKKVKQV